MFVPVEKLGLTEDEKVLVYQAIYYHHERENKEISKEYIRRIIEKDVYPNIDKIKQELKIDIREKIDERYVKYIGDRITEHHHLYKKIYPEYCMLKGLLHRLDHSSSAEIAVENENGQVIEKCTEEFMEDHDFRKNELQEFSQKNQNKNLLIIGSTGIGKTESALLWSKNSKTFFTLPIRVSINAIYDRISENMGYTNLGLLHSTALDYLEGKQKYEDEEEIYGKTRNLYYKITTCTIDQIFPFVFKYKGYEKMYSTLGYSKVIIDEVQAYSPDIVAIILTGLQKIYQLGGQFMVMTATLPRIYKEELEKMNVNAEFYRTGNSYTKAKSVEGNYPFGGELSGHVFFRDRFDGYDDGIYAGLRLIEILTNNGKTVSEMLEGINKYYSTPEIKIHTEDNIKFNIVNKVKEYCKNKDYNILDIDGVKVFFDDGSALVRASNTGPNITARFEAKSESRLEEIKNEFLNLVDNLKNQ